jgi:hypothetical protein
LEVINRIAPGISIRSLFCFAAISREKNRAVALELILAETEVYEMKISSRTNFSRENKTATKLYLNFDEFKRPK